MAIRKKQSKKTQASSRHFLWLIVGPLLFIASGVASYVTLAQLMPHETAPSSVDSSAASVRTPAKEPLTPQRVTERIKASYDGRYTLLNLDENNQPKNGELSLRIGKQSPLYQVEGMDFYNDIDNGASIDLATFTQSNDDVLPTAGDRKLRSEIATLLSSLNLKKTTMLGTYYSSINTDVYLGEGLICTVEAVDAPVTASSTRCGTIADYTTAAATYAPFASLAAETQPAATETPTLSNLRIRNSNTNGYKIASLNNATATALYYQAAAGKWTYFTATQSVLACTSYDTQVLRAAFSGEPCTDDGNNPSIVR